jgi:hypothetical protein
MGPTSELGPIDPQITSGNRFFSAYNVVESYQGLFARAVEERGNLQPYLQQLQNYDEREIAELRSAMDLSQDIAARVLASGMMGGLSEEEILAKIGMFLTPERTKVHGRPIYRDEAAECGLNIDHVDPDCDFWGTVYALYIRTNNTVQTNIAKCIESSDHSYSAPAPRHEELQ